MEFMYSLYMENKSFCSYEAEFLDRAPKLYARPKVEPRPLYRGRHRKEAIINMFLGFWTRGFSILAKRQSSKASGVNLSTTFVSVAQIDIFKVA